MAVAPTYVSQYDGAVPYYVTGAVKQAFLKGTVGASDTYVTNGFTFALANVPGFDDEILFVSPVTFSNGYWGVYIPTNNTTGLIKVFTAGSGNTTPVEVGNGSAVLQSATFIIEVFGK